MSYEGRAPSKTDQTRRSFFATMALGISASAFPMLVNDFDEIGNLAQFDSSELKDAEAWSLRRQRSDTKAGQKLARARTHTIVTAPTNALPRRQALIRLQRSLRVGLHSHPVSNLHQVR